MKITTRLDVSKSRGHDNLPPASFKKTPSLCKSLSHIFSSIKRTGCFPSLWKIGKVKPLHKKAEKRMANNYRPITLLDIALKILERCIFDELYPFIRPVLPNSQYGFLKHNSTIIQLICYLDEIYLETDNQNTVEAVYIDFAKAFDKISHSVLLNKLRKLGISGRLLALIKSYLADRRHFKVDKYYSSLLLVLSGVPQGSILGPLLFLLYVIDIPDGLVNAVYSFADDSKLLSWHSANSLCHLQADVRRILQWCNDNCMMLHPDKCHLLPFSQRKRAHSRRQRER